MMMSWANNNHRWMTLAVGLALMASVSCGAQTDTARVSKAPVTLKRTRLIAVGRANLLDTYLSQETFRGTEVGYVARSEWRRKGSGVSREMESHALVSWAGTRGNGNSMFTAMYNVLFGWHYSWSLAGTRVSLKAGGFMDATVGGTYNTHNTNNPAQARMAFAIDPSAGVEWNICRGRRPLNLSYEAHMPFVGLAFTPQFGQSYYEIFTLGNYDHNIVVTSPFSGLQWSNKLLLDFKLWRATLCVGYIGEIRQLEANSLKYHHYTHSVMVGWKF